MRMPARPGPKPANSCPRHLLIDEMKSETRDDARWNDENGAKRTVDMQNVLDEGNGDQDSGRNYAEDKSELLVAPSKVSRSIAGHDPPGNFV